ncbi:MAG: ABC transporter ATP-binding protein [Ahrensia sp.]
MSSSTKPVAIRVRNLRKSYKVFSSPGRRFAHFFFPDRKIYTEALVLDGIDLEITKGETVGIVGTNGAGKSTLLSIIAGVLNSDSGTVEVNGRVSALLSLGTGFVPDLTGRENVFLNAMTLGLTREQTEAKLDEILDFAAIGDAIEQPIRTYSSGMTSRLAFAVAIHTDPDILIIDETLSVGDEAFQRKCFARIDALKAKGLTILFVSHSAGAVLELCDRAIMLAKGKRLLTSTPRNVVTYYQKLVYSAADQRNAILEEIAQLDAEADPITEAIAASKADSTAAAKPKPKKPAKKPQMIEQFLPALTPVSTMEYASVGARISNVRITDADGNPLNVLLSNGSYHLRYTVTFDRPAQAARFSTLIKTINGLELGALWTTPRGEGLDVNEGDVVDVDFPIKLPLREGTYFVNAGATGIVDGEYITQHRIIDAAAFKIMPQQSGYGDRYLNLTTDEAAKADKLQA